MTKPIKIISIFFIITLITITSLYAKFETWIGLGFISHKANIAVEEKGNFSAYLQDTSSLKSVTFIGPTIDLSFIPYKRIPIGMKLSSEFLFPAGYNDGKGYRSYNFDFKNRNMIGITYDQAFNQQFGLYIESGYEFDCYRIATTNYKNKREKPEYNRFNNHSMYAELGFLSTVNNGYFKFGINYAHSIKNDASSLDLVFTGGFKF